MCWQPSGRTANNRFLPGITLPEDLQATGDLAEAAQAEALLLAVPAQVLHGFRAKAGAASEARHAAGDLRQGHRERQRQAGA